MKYRNRPTRCRQGTMHQSMLEANRCDELHAMQAGGLISDLEAHPQPRYRLDVNGVHICDYLPDFRYTDERGAVRVEDTKGILTRDCALKLRLMLAVHGVEVELIRKGRKR